MKIRVDQKYPRESFNGYYGDEKMTYEVYVWIKHLEEERKVAMDALEKIQKVHSDKDEAGKIADKALEKIKAK